MAGYEEPSRDNPESRKAGASRRFRYQTQEVNPRHSIHNNYGEIIEQGVYNMANDNITT